MEQSYQDRNNIVIAGCGPAGVFCAVSVVKLFEEVQFNDYSITLFDKSDYLKTLLVTGGGRCNITNSVFDIKDFASNYPRGEKFLYSIFSRFSNFDTLEFFKTIGVDTYTQSDGRVFPVSNSAKDVKNKMLNFLKIKNNVKFYKKTVNGASDIKDFGYKILSAGSRNTENLIKSFGHNPVPFRKSLCALQVEDFKYPEGVSVKSLDGDFLFTNDGITGPLAFKISSLNAFLSFPYKISIKLFDSDKLTELSKQYPKKSVGSLVSRFIPKSLAKVIVPDYGKNICEISDNTLAKYSVLNLTVSGLKNHGEIVNAGGVDLNEIDKNCKSRLYPNLWFCGEILNIDGFCGGFNLQNCWSTAYIVAKNVVESIMY